MKKQKKNAQGHYLQKRNNRWKWMAGATAATVAGATASHASLITITLTGNYISGIGENHLNADLTGDGHPDITIANASHYGGVASGNSTRTGGAFAYAKVTLNGILASANFYGQFSNFPKRWGQLGTQRFYTWRYGSDSIALTGSIPIFFKDLHINGGAPTSGSLEVSVTGTEIQLDSFTYNSNTPVQRASATVPDQGSSLALLAMGAGGVLALRRLRAAKSSNRQLTAQTP